jgi:hypothetical protein
MKKLLFSAILVLALLPIVGARCVAQAPSFNFLLLNGDCNGDNVVEDQDYSILSGAWYSSIGSPRYDPRADLNGDGWVEDTDLGIMGENWYTFGDDPLSGILTPIPLLCNYYVTGTIALQQWVGGPVSADVELLGSDGLTVYTTSVLLTGGSAPQTVNISVPNCGPFQVWAKAWHWLASSTDTTGVCSYSSILDEGASPSAPTFSPSGGTIIPQLVTMSSSPGAAIYYTTNNSIPVPGTGYTQLYTGPVMINSSLTLQAIAVAGNYQSVASTAAYYVTQIHVSQQAFGSVHDGASWDTAFLTISDALAHAVSGSEIWVAQPWFLPYQECLYVPSGVALYGQFTGYETSRSQRMSDVMASPWTTVYANGPSPIVTFAPFSTSTILDGFTLEGGTGLLASGDYCGMGSGAYVDCFSNVQISNDAFRSGSSIYCRDSSILVENSYVLNQYVQGSPDNPSSGVDSADIFIDEGSSAVITGNFMQMGSLCPSGVSNPTAAIAACGDSFLTVSDNFINNYPIGIECINYMDPDGTFSSSEQISNNTVVNGVTGVLCCGSQAEVANNILDTL